MSEFTNPLNKLRIASPCSANWNEMIGDERKRYCGECKLNVYNLSGLTRREAENLILQSEDRVCMRIYRRADGTVLTKDCPVGWQAIKRRVSRAAAAFASMIFAALSGVGLTSYFAEKAEDPLIMGAIAIETGHPTPMGEISVEPEKDTLPHYEMGKPAIDENLVDGRISNLDEVKEEIKKSRKR